MLLIRASSLRDLKLGSGTLLPFLSAKPLEESIPRNVHLWIEEQCARVPQRIAAVCGDSLITYAELNQRASF